MRVKRECYGGRYFGSSLWGKFDRSATRSAQPLCGEAPGMSKKGADSE